jgi:hypothetical protein
LILKKKFARKSAKIGDFFTLYPAYTYIPLVCLWQKKVSDSVTSFGEISTISRIFLSLGAFSSGKFHRNDLAAIFFNIAQNSPKSALHF